MSKVFKISEDYLDELISYTGKSLVGKIMKRFEICKNSDIVKSFARELIYEEFRQLRNLIIAHDKGLNIKIFKFNKKKDNLTPEVKE